VEHVDELNRLTQAAAALPPSGWHLAELSSDAERPAEVLLRVREVLSAAFSLGEGRELAEWARRLPAWFVRSHQPKGTEEEEQARIDAWRRLSPRQRAAWEAQTPWTLPEWVSWMPPSERSWRLWRLEALDRRILVELVAAEWPCGIGALSWVFRAAGGAPLIER
jgi:hypothetical protein